AKEKSHPTAAPTDGRNQRRQIRAGGGQRGQERIQVLCAPECPEQPEPPRDRLEARPLVEPQRARQGRQPSGMWKPVEQAPEESVVRLGSAYAAPLQLPARGLEELAEWYARGAGGLARATPQAKIEMARESRRERHAPLCRRPHEIDPPARRVHLLAEHAV